MQHLEHKVRPLDALELSDSTAAVFRLATGHVHARCKSPDNCSASEIM